MRSQIKPLFAALVMAVGIGQANAGETFGSTSGQWIFLGVTDFTPDSESCALQYGAFGYYSVVPAPGGTCTGNEVLRANVELPEGSKILWQRLYYQNDSAGPTFSHAMWYYGYTSSVLSATGTAAVTNLGSASTANNEDNYRTSTLDFDPDPVFDTYINSSTLFGPSEQRNYFVLVNAPAGTGSAFKGVAVAYQRQAAPAPTAASFSDVPTNHPFFNEVQQLSKSGITQGCGGGQYCPDQPVTRGQMAAFLTRALGLHWDWSTNAE